MSPDVVDIAKLLALLITIVLGPGILEWIKGASGTRAARISAESEIKKQEIALAASAAKTLLDAADKLAQSTLQMAAAAASTTNQESTRRDQATWDRMTKQIDDLQREVSRLNSSLELANDKITKLTAEISTLTALLDNSLTQRAKTGV